MKSLARLHKFSSAGIVAVDDAKLRSHFGNIQPACHTIMSDLLNTSRLVVMATIFVKAGAASRTMPRLCHHGRNRLLRRLVMSPCAAFT